MSDSQYSIGLRSVISPLSQVRISPPPRAGLGYAGALTCA